jgi:hypothetical protein
MNSRANKRGTATKNSVSSTPKKRLPAYKRQPDLYYSHVWLDREIYSQVLTFIGWERQKKYSVKMAVRILLELGLKQYVIDQINLVTKAQAEAKSKGQEPPAPTHFIKDMREKSKRRGLPPVA